MSFSSELEEIGLDNIYEILLNNKWPERLGTKNQVDTLKLDLCMIKILMTKDI